MGNVTSFFLPTTATGLGGGVNSSIDLRCSMSAARLVVVVAVDGGGRLAAPRRSFVSDRSLLPIRSSSSSSSLMGTGAFDSERALREPESSDAMGIEQYRGSGILGKGGGWDERPLRWDGGGDKSLSRDGCGCSWSI